MVYATSEFIGTAAIWCCTLLKASTSPKTWETYVAATRKEFVSEYHERRSCDVLRSCKQTGSVSEYVSKFQNIVLTIPDMSSKEKGDRFVSVLQSKVQSQVR